MKTSTLVSHITLKKDQRIITTMMKRIGTINLLPSDVTIENNRPVLIVFDDGSDGWVRPSHLNDYTEN